MSLPSQIQNDVEDRHEREVDERYERAQEVLKEQLLRLSKEINGLS